MLDVAFVTVQSIRKFWKSHFPINVNGDVVQKL